MFLFVQIRKQQKDHAELIEDYRTKQQQQRALQQKQQQQPAAQLMMPAGAPPIPQTLLSQPMVPLQTHPSVPNITPGWTAGGGAPATMGQRMPPHLPPQMPPTLPNASQATPHAQTPPAVGPSLTTPAAGFSTGPRGPAGVPDGCAGDGSAPTPQVTHLELTRTLTQGGVY